MQTLDEKKEEVQEEEEKEGKKRWLLLLLLLLLLLAVAAGIWALRLGRSTPQPDVPASSSVESDAPSGGTVSLTYSDAVDIDLSGQKIALLFANPSKSTWDASVRLVIQDTVIAQSGRLAPGEEVTELDLPRGAKKQLSEGSCEGLLLVSFYDRQSGQEAMLNTEIPVTVTVAK